MTWRTIGSTRLLAWVAAGAFALVLTGCGGGSNEAARAKAPETNTTVPTAGGSGEASRPPAGAASASTVVGTTTGDQPVTSAGNGSDSTMQTAMFGGGCFWGVEHIFRKQVPGVVDAVSGFSGGHVANPTYKQVCYEHTGHVEVVQVTFDPTKVTYEQLVDYFFRLHDPTQGDRQGPDTGEQYRSVIYYYTDEQREAAERVKARRQAKYEAPITTTIEKAGPFYKAEEYHQRYYERNGKTPYCHVLRPD